MKIIVFAGGSGKRFWPASRLNSPKQFLNILEEKPMIRITIDRLLTKFPIEDIFLSTGSKYRKEIKALLPDLKEENIIFEPEMRDTGPAVSLAVSYVNKLFPNESIACLWSDHLIKDTKTFVQSLEIGDKIAQEQNKVALITVPCRYPSVHRGYIKFGKLISDTDNESIKIMEFEEFVEKPNEDKAQEYFESGNYGWNPGYWVFKGEAYLNKIKKSAPIIYEVCQEIVNSDFSEESVEKFRNLEKIAADYIFPEKIYRNEALVVFSEFGWSDIGEWVSLKEALETSHDANVTKGKVVDLDSTDSLIFNYEDDKLVATIGLDKYIIVNTKDVVAVFPKDKNSKLKELLKGFEGDKELQSYL